VFEPPSGTEQSNGAALVPVQILARSHADVVLQTRQPFAVSTDWSDEEAANAIEGYLRDGHPNAELATTLRTALDLRRQLTDLSHDRASLDERLNDLRQNADETRMNLLTIERNRAAADLRAQLTSRLAQLATQIDQLTRRIVEFDTQIGERRVRLAESVRSVQLDLTTHAPSSVHTPSPG
jgi:DNA repair exonuclease SbcCD ATPase subunit